MGERRRRLENGEGRQETGERRQELENGEGRQVNGERRMMTEKTGQTRTMAAADKLCPP